MSGHWSLSHASHVHLQSWWASTSLFRGKQSGGAQGQNRSRVSLDYVLVTRTSILMRCSRAHRPVNLEKYPTSDAVRRLYPVYGEIKSKMKPTMVHLQV